MKKNIKLLFICIFSITTSTIMSMDTSSILPNDPIRTHNSEGLFNIKRPNDGNTPLHLAIQNYISQKMNKDSSDEIFNAVLQGEPNPFILNHNNKTPLDEAKEFQKKGSNNLSYAIDMLKAWETVYYKAYSE